MFVIKIIANICVIRYVVAVVETSNVDKTFYSQEKCIRVFIIPKSNLSRVVLGKSTNLV